MLSRQNIVLFLGTLLVLFVLFFVFVSPTTRPWVESGRLVLTVRAAPSAGADLTLLLGIDDVELYTADGDTEKVTVRTRRVLLQPGSDTLLLVLDTSVPVGNYSGFGFTLTSPELRNAWQEDVAPTYVSLVGDFVRLDTPYHIEEGITSSILLTFDTLSAIHEKEGTQHYLPVLQIETRFNATALLEDGVHIQGGTIENNATFGMDWDGRMRHNFRAQAVAEVVPTETEPLPEEPLPEESETTLPLTDEELVEFATTSTSTPETDTEETVE